jgi:hypothetical protein
MPTSHAEKPETRAQGLERLIADLRNDPPAPAALVAMCNGLPADPRITAVLQLTTELMDTLVSQPSERELLHDLGLSDLDGRTHYVLGAVAQPGRIHRTIPPFCTQAPEWSIPLHMPKNADKMRTEYYQKKPWRNFSKLMKLAFPYCELCHVSGESALLEVHHLTYRHFGSEPLNSGDVRVLCDPCHLWRHTVIDSWREFKANQQRLAQIEN